MAQCRARMNECPPNMSPCTRPHVVQKSVFILGQPLTRTRMPWLIELVGQRSAGRGPRPGTSAVPMRESVVMMCTVLTRSAPRSIARFVRSLALSGLAMVAMAATAQAETPAGYMKRVGNELLAASRSGSSAQFAMVLNANADVPSIGLNALGDYARVLPREQRPVYYNGMINFIARYASKEAPKYPVARF